jgi:NAD(P)-dependent dehydrogenase (short-subunit alcohol dehydrogenase family)
MSVLTAAATTAGGVRADLGDLDSVQAFVAAFHAKHKKLHILINNGAPGSVATERGAAAPPSCGNTSSFAQGLKGGGARFDSQPR